MSVTIGQLIEGQVARPVGRDRERAILHELLAEGGPLVVFVHGIAGVGKSTLLRAFTGEARALGATVIPLDCGAIEPTERGLLDAFASATGETVASLDAVVARLAGIGGVVVLALDTYELFRGLEPWLRRVVVPALPGNVRVVLSGREAPMSGWPSALGAWFRSVSLGGLSRDDAESLLREAGVGSSDVERINHIARGHPLSLMLAASALRDRPEIDVGALTVTAIVEELTRRYLALLDPLTRRALDAAAVVRRPTRSLLGAMLPDVAPQDAYERVLALPFVEVSDDGLVLHETVREAVAILLRSIDPDGSRQYRAAAWRCLTDEVRRASSHEMWRYTADLLYILQNPIVREAFFPTTEHLYVVDAARPEDAGAIMDIVARHEPPASARGIEVWWRWMPESFRVVHDRSGAIVGFHTFAEADKVPHRVVAMDPLAGSWWEHLRRASVPSGKKALLNRIELSRDHGDRTSPIQATLWLDVKRRYMDLRPDLRRIYSVMRDVTAMEALSVLGFRTLPGEPITFDGIAYHSIWLDFGPGSVDGWLAGLVAAELHIDDSMLDVTQRQLVVDGRRVDLTTLEFQVLDYLAQRQGRVVDRASLLRDVWGYADGGGSNVIEVLMRSLRRKLGDQAGSIETVRGLGYRLSMPEERGPAEASSQAGSG